MKILILLAAVCYCVSGATTPSPPIVWKDCAADPSNTVLTINKFNLSPSPVSFPGDVFVTLNLTVNKPITELYIDVQLNKTTDLGDIPIPCIQNIGTCEKIRACTLLDVIKNGSSLVSASLGLQIDAILLSVLGRNAQCPINPETVAVTDEKLKLTSIPAALALIANGNYNIRISVYETMTSTQDVGCVQFTAAIANGGSGGFLFGG